VLLLQDLTSCCSTQPFVSMSCLEMQQLAKHKRTQKNFEAWINKLCVLNCIKYM
jgi:hypothetical protein